MATYAPSADDLSLRQRIGQFFFDEEVPYGLAVVRIVMPLVLLFPTLERLPFMRELYSSDGAPASLWETFGRPDVWPVLPGTVAVALYCAMIFFLLASSAGWFSRISLIASTVLYTYFTMTDAVSTVTKYTVIASHILLLLSLSNCGAVWSLDAWRKGIRRNSWPGTPAVARPKFPAWQRRLMQILVGVIYFGAAITKMHTPSYFNGDQLIFWMLSNWNFANPVGEYLTLVPALLVMFAYVAIVWEILFLFACWRGWGRRIMLTLGVMFHLMTTLTLGLYVFPMVAITIYFCFLNEQDVRHIAWYARRVGRKFGHAPHRPTLPTGIPHRLPEWAQLPAPAAFALCMLGSVAMGVQLEHLADPYGMRRPDGPYTLRELDRNQVQAMLQPTESLREADKFYAMDVGTTQVGGFLVDHRSEFTQGERVIIEISLNSPHEDMWVECNLHDAENRMIDRVGQVVPREFNRAYANYMLANSVEPGEYFIVLKSGGEEVARRKIVLHPARMAAVAN